MRLRILIATGCLAVTALILILLIGARSMDLLAVKKEHVLMRSLRKPFAPATWQAQRQNLDTNSIPLLSHALQTRPGAVDKAYAWAWSNAPSVIRTNLSQPLDSNVAHQIRIKASALLADPKIGGSVPPSTIVKELRDPFWGIRMNALACLNNAVLSKVGPEALGDQRETIFSLVLTAAQDPQMEVRMSAVYCLGFFKDAPDQVIPVLSKALNDEYPDVRIRAAMVFYRFDPARAEKAGAVTTAFACLNSNGPHGSGYLAADFLRKEGKLPPDGQP